MIANHETIDRQPSPDFLDWLIVQQLRFERERVGVDGSLFDLNTVEHGIKRGVIGEGEEALEAWLEKGLEETIKELVDVLIFLGSVFAHLGVNAQQILELVVQTIEKMHRKYDKEYFRGRTVQEAIIFSREIHASNKLEPKTE